MTERERLIEILRKPIFPHELVDPIEAVADYLLDNGVTVQKWIPVTERLPGTEDKYLCNVESFAFPGSYYQTILYCDNHGFREGHIYTDAVTHWMPLPEPPKGD